MSEAKVIQKKWDGVERRNKKPKPKPIPTGPDLYMGGDGLPDWMQFTITGGMFAILYWVLYLLFHPTLELDETHRDLSWVHLLLPLVRQLTFGLDILRKKISNEHSLISRTFSIWFNCIFFFSKRYFMVKVSIYIS